MDTGFTQAAGGSALEVISSNAGDTTQTFTVFGLNASNVPTSATVTLNGTVVVAIPGTWNLESAGLLSASCAGTVTLRIASGGATVFTMLTTVLTKGRQLLDIPVTGALTIVADGASVTTAIVRGTNVSGVAIAERLVLNGTTPVTLTGAFTHYTSIELGNVAAARTVTLGGKMISALFTAYPSLKKLEDLIESTSSDFTFVSLVGSASKYDPDRLDQVAATSILTAVTLRAILDDIITVINLKSQLVTAERSTGASGAPTNIGPVFLSGGHEGDVGNPGVPTADNADWLAAIDLLKQIRVNTLMPATDDDAIHAAVDEHCAFMCGAGRSERDAVVAAAADETFTALKARALALNSRHTRLVAQEALLFNSEGVAEWQPPMFQAALVAAAQAGSAVGTPLTYKFFNVQGVRQHSTWNPTDDVDDAILAGLCFMKFIDGKGIRMVRNVTTYLVDENVVYSEASANQALDKAVYEYRARLDAKVGKKGFPGTVRAAKAAAIAVLDDMLKDKDPFLVGYTDPSFTLVKDKLENQVGMSPVLPINFVDIAVDVFATTITA